VMDNMLVVINRDTIIPFVPFFQQEEGEGIIRITSSPSFDILRTASSSLFSFAIGEEGEPKGRDLNPVCFKIRVLMSQALDVHHAFIGGENLKEPGTSLPCLGCNTSNRIESQIQ